MRLKRHFWNWSCFFFFFSEMWGDAEISINRWLLVICRIIKTFQCRESLSFRTTSLWGHTQQIPSIYVFNDNRKNKRGLWRMVAGGNIWLSPSVCQSQQHEKKNLCNKTQTPGCSLINFPPSSQFQEFYEWKMSGDRFSKAVMACVSWAYHAVLVSSCRLERHRRDGTPTFTSHYAVWL